jgi:hypothetical protein
MDRDTGGYAFPHIMEHLHEPVTAGMTLRDYFAAKAMQGLLATDIDCGPKYAQIIADNAYGMADVMLKARGQA